MLIINKRKSMPFVGGIKWLIKMRGQKYCYVGHMDQDREYFLTDKVKI